MTKAFEDLKSPNSMYENLFYAWEHYISLFGLGVNVNNCDEQIWGLDCLYKRSTHRKNCSKKSGLTINIVTLVNLEPNFGFMLEIKSIPNYLIIPVMSLNMGHQLDSVGLNECELEVLVLTCPKI